ncbi:hypothetical protein SLA2020_382250 [Shorea laevis]
MEISVDNKAFTLVILLLLSFSFPPSAFGLTCYAGDKQALLGFKARITSDPSGLLNSWNSSTDCCSWEGIGCDSSGRVLNVSRPGLISDPFPFDTSMKGTLSPSLGNLTFLQLLDLSDLKELKGHIPPELGKLTRLNYLFLYSNKLTGSIPSTLRYLSQLKKLYLDDNQISGTIPPVFWILTFTFRTWSFREQIVWANSGINWYVVIANKIDLHGNNLSDPLPSSIGKLKLLTDLDFSENRITGSIPQSIGGLSALNLLYLHQNQISGSIPSTISGLSSLKHCWLFDNKLTGSLPPSIGMLPNIERLYLDDNRLTGKLPETIGHPINLTVLSLSDNNFTGRIPPSVGNLKNLQYLNLSGNQLSGPIPPQLVKLQSLQDLDLSFNPLELVSIPDCGPIDANIGVKPAMDSITSLILSHIHWEDQYQSRNKLSGAIPGNLLNLTGLNQFDVSNNRPSGMIPPHPSIIPASAFRNNPALCGAPLPPCKHA